MLTQHHTASHASAQRGARVRHHTRCIGPLHGPGAGSTFPCAPIDARRRLIVSHTRRRAAPQGVCGRRRAERRPRGGSQFEARIPGSTLTPFPCTIPARPSCIAALPNATAGNRPPPHGGAEPAPPHGAASGAAQRGAMCVVVALKSMPIWFSSRGAREVITSMPAPAHQQGHISEHVGANECDTK